MFLVSQLGFAERNYKRLEARRQKHIQHQNFRRKHGEAKEVVLLRIRGRVGPVAWDEDEIARHRGQSRHEIRERWRKGVEKKVTMMEIICASVCLTTTIARLWNVSTARVWVPCMMCQFICKGTRWELGATPHDFLCLGRKRMLKAKMAPSWGQVGANFGQVGPSRAQVEQVGFKLGKVGTR